MFPRCSLSLLLSCLPPDSNPWTYPPETAVSSQLDGPYEGSATMLLSNSLEARIYYPWRTIRALGEKIIHKLTSLVDQLFINVLIVETPV
jgi:hypothetical protein